MTPRLKLEKETIFKKATAMDIQANEAVISDKDPEKNAPSSEDTSLREAGAVDDVFIPKTGHGLWEKLLNAGVELRGDQPVPVELRTDTRYLNICTILLTSMTSLLPFSVGSAVPLFYGLNFRDSTLMIIFFNLLFCIPASYIVTIAPLTGMRQMIQSRYVFGKYPNMLSTLVIVLIAGGFGCTATIIAGQSLSYMSDGNLSQPLGMLIIVLISLVVSFFGYRILHLYERWAWIPVLVAIIFTIGCAGSDLAQPAQETPSTPRHYLGVIALAGGSQITWAMLVGDYCVYMPPTTPRLRLSAYMTFGICFPYTVFQIVAAAIAGAIPAHPAWQASYASHGIGGVLGAILDKVGGFGKFILCILALSVVGSVSRDYYTVSVNLQVLVPVLNKVPRAFLAVIAAGAAFGVSVAAYQSFYSSLTTFLSIIGYYGASWVTVSLIEWFHFRKADPASFDAAIWNDARKLPSGLPALASVLIPWALIVPSMDQSWYVGPIAAAAGDLGLFFAAILSALLYFPLRSWEVRSKGGRLQGE